MNYSPDIYTSDPSLRFLMGEGEMPARIRAYDWSSTALGHPAHWSNTFKNALAIMLDSAAPGYIAWGSEYVQLYNDAYISVLGPRKHPAALGITTPETWAEIWDFIGPRFDGVMTTGRAVSSENALLPMLRRDALEECYFNFTFSPLHDPDGKVAAVFVFAWETTYEVIGTRRTNAIRALVQGLSQADDLCSIRAVFEKTCLDASQDIPFGLWYDIRTNRRVLDLAVAVGLPPGSMLSPAVLDPACDAFYAGRIALEAPVTACCAFPEQLFGTATQRPLGIGPRHLYIKPVCYTAVQRPDAYIILGVNPLRPNDEAQHEFLRSVRFHLESAIRRVSRHELEWREREHNFASVMSVLPCMLWTTDSSQRAVFFNQTWLDFTGRALEQELDGGWVVSLHPDDLGLLQQFRREAEGNRIVSVELRLLRSDGQYRWVFCEATPRLNIKGEFCGYIGTCFDVTDRKKTEQEVLASQAELRKLYDLLQTVRDEERRALAREVHDHLGQILSAAKIDIALLENDFALEKGKLSRRRTLAELRSARALIERSIQVVRQLATDLRPPELESQGLLSAIEWHARDFERRTKIRCEVQLRLDLHDLNEQNAIALFRIFQEAMTNVLRHAKATRIWISLDRAGNQIRLRVLDNGIGIQRALPVLSNGLKGMRERAAIAGGRLVVGTVGRSGTLVGVRMPIRAPHPRAPDPAVAAHDRPS